MLSLYGGERGIQTPGTFNSTPDFESGTFDHSDISPELLYKAHQTYLFSFIWGA